jgi:hypothetical protein
MDELPWQKAAAFAARAHEHHFRKDGETPYISHPARVAMTLSVVFGCNDPIALAAAFLHDTIEDSTTDYDDVEKHFGVVVADIVAALTKNMILPERLREKDYDQRLARADWRARLVKLGDVHDNYTDSITRGGKSPARTGGKARRALALAEADCKEHPETRRACEAVRALLARNETRREPKRR